MAHVVTKFDTAVYDSSDSIYEGFISVWTEDNDTVSATAYRTNIASVTYTEQNDTVVSKAITRLTADITYTEADDTMSSTSLLLIKAISNYTEDDDVLISTTRVPVQASIIYMEENDTMTGYMLRLPFGGGGGDTGSRPYVDNSGSSGRPYIDNSGPNPDNDRPYEESF